MIWSKRNKHKDQSIKECVLLVYRYVYIVSAIVVLFLVTLISPHLISAQSTVTISAAQVDLREFPLIRTTLTVRDNSGLPIQDLRPDQVQVIENNEVIPLKDLQAFDAGVHFILAINADIALDKRDSSNTSIYEYLLQKFIDFPQTNLENSNDTYSLTLNDSRQYRQLSDPNSWRSALLAYQPDMRKAAGKIDSLKEAIDIATYAEGDQDQVLLYITPEPRMEDLQTIETLRERASQTNLVINVWMVGNDYVLTTARGQALLALVESTGGSLVIYDAKGDLPEPSSYIQNFGTRYSVSYESQVRESGTHKQQFSINIDGQEFQSAEASFRINVSPPAPVFLTPPSELTYQILTDEQGNVIKDADTQVELEILIEFPDGYPRDLKYVQLLNNGTVIQENTQSPFNIFTFDYGALSESCVCNLQVKLEDVLGFESNSTILPLKVNVVHAEVEEEKPLFQKEWFIFAGLGLVVIVTGVFVLWILPKILQKKSKPSNKLPQRVVSKFEDQPNLLAKLVRLDQHNRRLQEDAISISAQNNTLGTDPALCNIVISDPSIDPLHARIYITNRNEIMIADLSSTAGTWVNFAPISQNAVKLENGDMIHVGKAAFRIKIT